MDSISIKNLRSLVDVGRIEIKPLTVAVGRNSSGKSSFLRLFPLLKQSIETRTSEPILWYGDYVDFGDFNNSLSHMSSEESIELGFDFYLENLKYLNRYRYSTTQWRTNISSGKDKKIKLQVILKIGKKLLEQIDININNQNISIRFNERGNILSFLVNNENMLKNEEKILCEFKINGMLPELFYKAKIQRTNIELHENNIDLIFMRQCVDKLYEKAYKTTQRYTIAQACNYIDIGSKEEILKSIKVNTMFPPYLKKNLEDIEISDEYFMRINNLLIASHISDILNYCNHLIIDEAISVKYIKPLRFNVERYYRVQGLNIDEIDASGENIPMFLYSLSENTRKNFEEWAKSKFGVIFTIKSKEGHVSLIIKDEISNEEFNLADVGYGYSQVLPIIVLLWNCFIRKDNIKRILPSRIVGNKITLVIEQPELHLHPGFQARLVDLIISLINEAMEQSIDVKFIIETHSETIINRLGHLIAKNKIKNNLVNILMFEKNTAKETSIKSLKFNEKGMVSGWPIGFFAPEKIK